MKSDTVGHSEKCALFTSLQQMFQPSTAKDTGIPPCAAPGQAPLLPLAEEGFEMAIYRAAHHLPPSWDALLPANQLMMSRRYLKAVEEAPPQGMSFAYLLFFKKKKIVGLAVCQLMEFRALEHIQSLRQNAGGTPGQQIWQQLKRALARRLNYRLIICGATQFTGMHGFAFSDPELLPTQKARLLPQAFRVLAQALTTEGWRPDALVLKDLGAAERHQLQPLEEMGYSAWPFQPNMVFRVERGWRAFEDYLEALSSKYRVRARRAFKKGRPLHRLELQEKELNQFADTLHEMYLSLAENADFNLIQLPKEYFSRLKAAFPEKFRAFGYFHRGELIGFSTTLCNGSELEAHFLGFRQEENRRFQLYLNMLYDIIRQGLEEEEAVEKIIFSRTALEIKSSVGAKPESAYNYIYHFSPWVNAILPTLVRWLEPKEEEWQPRHPFK